MRKEPAQPKYNPEEDVCFTCKLRDCIPTSVLCVLFAEKNRKWAAYLSKRNHRTWIERKAAQGKGGGGDEAEVKIK